MRKIIISVAALSFAMPAASQEVITGGQRISESLQQVPIAVTAVDLDQYIYDDVIVTATRQSQDRLKYPAAIEVVDGDRLEELSVVHAAESLNSIPGVHIHRGSGLEHLTSIRSPILTGGAGAGSFLYLQDGVPLRSAGFANVNGLFEAQMELAGSTEVFKGPGSVLYGSNALHGLINVVSRAPYGKHRYKIMANDDGYLSFDGQTSGDHHIVSLSLAHDNGFRDESGYDQQKLSVRVDDTLGDWDVSWQGGYQNLNQETAGFIRGDDAYRDDVRFTNPNPEAYRDSRSARSHLKLSKSLDEDKSVQLIPYARWTDMEFLRHFVPGQATEKVGHWSVGALNTLYGKNYILGFDAEYTKGFLDEFQTGASRFSFVQGEHYDYDVEAITLAAYGEYDFALSPKTELNIGARAEYVDYSYDNKTDTGTSGRFRRVDDRSDDFFIVTPKITLSHELSDDVNFYARAVRGARAPQVTDLYSLQTQQTPGEIKSETLDSLEAGFKGSIENLEFEVAAYAMQKDNFFFRNSDGFNVTNGKTSHRGLELSVVLPISEIFEVSGNINLARHEYDFTDLVGSASSSVTKGDPVDSAPDVFGHAKIKANLTAGVSTELEWRHMGDYALDPGNTEFYSGHDVMVLRGQYKISDAAILFARIDNLWDQDYANRADFSFGAERYFPGRPRTIFWGIRGEF